jgi:hypothetical protein
MVRNNYGRCCFFGKGRKRDGFSLGDRIRETGETDCGYSASPSGVWAAHGIGTPLPAFTRCKCHARTDAVRISHERFGGPARSRGLKLSGGNRPDPAYAARTVGRHSIRHPLIFRLQPYEAKQITKELMISAGKAGE